jgi:hypothetical protein
MSLGLPDKKSDEESADIKVDENRTMTVMLEMIIRWFFIWVCWLRQ